MMPCSSVRMRRIAFGALAALVMTGPAVAIAAESATQTTAPANTPAIAYGPNGADLTTAIPTWSYTRNSVIQANATTKTAGNNAQGSLVAGWPVDIFNRAGVVRETLDWTEGVIATPSTAYLFPSMGVALTSVTQAGGTVTATGAWQGGPVSAVTSYTALGEAPVVKVDVQLTNNGAAAIDSSFGYIMDPDDTGAQTSILQGVGNNPGLVSSGWTSNFTYQGPPSNATASPGHAIAWAADNPAAISAGSAYTSVWFPVSLAPGATDTITLYHIVDLPAAGTDPTANARNWASQLLTLDPTAAAEVSQVAGRVSGAGGADLGGVTVKARRIDSTLAATATSLADGTYSMLLQPGTYTLTASRLGYTSDSRSVEVVSAGGPYQLDFEVDPVAASADTEREIPGALGEGGPDDIVLETSSSRWPSQMRSVIRSWRRPPKASPSTSPLPASTMESTG